MCSVLCTVSLLFNLPCPFRSGVVSSILDWDQSVFAPCNFSLLFVILVFELRITASVIITKKMTLNCHKKVLQTLQLRPACSPVWAQEARTSATNTQPTAGHKTGMCVLKQHSRVAPGFFRLGPRGPKFETYSNLSPKSART